MEKPKRLRLRAVCCNAISHIFGLLTLLTTLQKMVCTRGCNRSIWRLIDSARMLVKMFNMCGSIGTGSVAVGVLARTSDGIV